MSYKFSRGAIIVGDISGSDDPDRNTGIDFGDDTISLVAGGATRLKVADNGVTSSVALLAEDNLVVDGRIGIGVDDPSVKLEVGGNMKIGQYIYHRNDDDTLINFTDDRIRLKAGGMGMVGMHKKSSAPHQVTINNGNNNIDFHINSNNNANDPILMSDASTARIGIGTENPTSKLHVSGAAGTVVGLIVGDLYVTGSRAKLVVEETDGSDYRVVIDPISGPLINFGDDTADSNYMTLGAFSGINNLNTKSRDFHLYGTNTTTGFYFDESAGRFGIGTTSPASTLDVVGSNSRSIATITGVSNAIGESHSTVLMNGDSGNCAAQLPAASGCAGRIYIFKRLDNSGNGVKIQSNGSEEIEGSTNDLDISNQYEVFTLQCDGTRWWIISDNHV